LKYALDAINLNKGNCSICNMSFIKLKESKKKVSPEILTEAIKDFPILPDLSFLRFKRSGVKRLVENRQVFLNYLQKTDVNVEFSTPRGTKYKDGAGDFVFYQVGGIYLDENMKEFNSSERNGKSLLRVLKRGRIEKVRFRMNETPFKGGWDEVVEGNKEGFELFRNEYLKELVKNKFQVDGLGFVFHAVYDTETPFASFGDLDYSKGILRLGINDQYKNKKELRKWFRGLTA